MVVAQCPPTGWSNKKLALTYILQLCLVNGEAGCRWGCRCCLTSHFSSDLPTFHMKTRTTTIVLRPFVRDYPGESVPEETLTHPPSWSSNLYQLPSTTIHSILPIQITCLAIFLRNLSPWRLEGECKQGCTLRQPNVDISLRSLGPAEAPKQDSNGRKR